MGRAADRSGLRDWSSDPVLIGLTGKAGAGKNTVADIICELIPGAEQYSLAGPLKDMALAIDPLIWIEKFSGGYSTSLAEYVRDTSWDFAKQKPSVRRFLQRLGTEGVRGTFGDDAWVDLMWKWWGKSPAKVGVVTDVRFPNEAEAVDVVIDIFRGEPELSGDLAAHPSEAQQFSTDVIILNMGDMSTLREQVSIVLRQLHLLTP